MFKINMFKLKNRMIKFLEKKNINKKNKDNFLKNLEEVSKDLDLHEILYLDCETIPKKNMFTLTSGELESFEDSPEGITFYLFTDSEYLYNFTVNNIYIDWKQVKKCFFEKEIVHNTTGTDKKACIVLKFYIQFKNNSKMNLRIRNYFDERR